jgi:hypothetical protein
MYILCRYTITIGSIQTIRDKPCPGIWTEWACRGYQRHYHNAGGHQAFTGCNNMRSFKVNKLNSPMYSSKALFFTRYARCIITITQPSAGRAMQIFYLILNTFQTGTSLRPLGLLFNGLVEFVL